MALTELAKPKTKLRIRVVLLFIGMTLTLFLAGCAIVPYSPKIRDEEGIVIPGSIVSLEKEHIWFENSAHSPVYEEPDRFNEIMIDKIRAAIF